MRTGAFARPRRSAAVRAKKRSSEPWASSTSSSGGSKPSRVVAGGRSRRRGPQESEGVGASAGADAGAGAGAGAGASAGAGADASAGAGACAGAGGCTAGVSCASLFAQAGARARRTQARRARTIPTVHSAARAVRRLGAVAVGWACVVAAAGCGSSSAGTVPPPPDAGGDDGGVDPIEFSTPPTSCAYTCPDPATTCPEGTTPYACPSTGAWAAIPHAATCAAWDGTFPAPAQGRCTASAPSGEAAKYAGPDPDHPGTLVLPDGRRIAPAGSDWVFDESDLQGGITTYLGAIPGTSLVVTIDDGPVDHAVRVVDTT